MAGWPPKKGVAFLWCFVIRDADGDLVDGAEGLDVEYSGDGGAFAGVAAAETELGGGAYSCLISAAEMNYSVVALLCKTSTVGAKNAAQIIYTSVQNIDDIELGGSTIDSLGDAISDNAAGPKRVAGDSGTVEQHPIPDQLAAEYFRASKAAMSKRSRGIRVSKVRPPGSE